MIRDLMLGFVGIAGTLLGLVCERLLRHWGRVHLHAQDWACEYAAGASAAGRVPVVAPDKARMARFQFRLEAFNGRDDPTGLRSLRLEIDYGDRRRLSLKPEAAPAAVARWAASPEHAIEFVNLPPKQWVVLTLSGVINQHVADFPRATVFLTAVEPSGRTRRIRVRGPNEGDSLPAGTIGRGQLAAR